MTKKSNFIFKGLTIIAWVIFVGLCIEAGGFVVNFAVSLIKPEFIENLYQKLDLSEVYNQSKKVFFSIYTFILTISILKAYLFYVLIRLLSNLNLEKPFNTFVSRQITQISYFTFSIGILGYLAQQTTRNLIHHGFETEQLHQFWSDSQAFILMSAIVYVIAAIFNKGVEIQSENDLTV